MTRNGLSIDDDDDDDGADAGCGMRDAVYMTEVRHRSIVEWGAM